ncbi:digestive organ expansion factor [Ephemerocybe angulata]|uniref:U3 small nucleolar RNA-associated protein 25 n=1 Tax=Ephemerocybe angulata TaxID=980116 RepID=A0A8H6IGM6_9AGAR|nr:digestive organ expansion factor [Tulosesus angulatus]
MTIRRRDFCNDKNCSLFLNVSATRLGKRKIEADDFVPAEKLNKRKSISFSETVDGATGEVEDDAMDVVEDVEPEVASDPYELHFGPDSKNKNAWSTTQETLGRLGPATISSPNIPSTPINQTLAPIDVLDRVKAPFQAHQVKCTGSQVETQNNLLSLLSSRKDVYLPSASVDSRKSTRQVIALHALNHISKKRKRVLKNNERLAKASSDSPPEDVQDQGFTRPSVLARFLSEYDLPAGAVDKLTSAEPGTYPLDHVETFKGNVDDNFRIGVKMTRKSVRMFTEFYGCDLILASPLGLRRSIEKEKNADYLSSIEVLIVDQMDALMMQNWDHVKFVMSHLNKLPKESHDTDFSRIKPWYLDGLSQYLRQSILLSSFETPEMRSLFNGSLKNVAGKVKIDKRCNPQDEAEKRFHHFTTQTLPSILKSAVQSTSTVIFVPSSYDFIRVHNHFRKQTGITFTVLSEESFLLVSERFHFYKRYKIRGIRNLVFYGPPDHPQYFTEYLSYPFLDDDVDSSDVTCRVLYSKYDWFRLERVAGTESAVELVKGV